MEENGFLSGSAVVFSFLYVSGNTIEMLMHFYINSGDGLSNDDSDSEVEDQTTANLALLKLDEWLHLRMDPEVSNV